MHPLMILVAGPYRSGTNDDQRQHGKAVYYSLNEIPSAFQQDA